ncbi:MAG: hypothetical protein Kow0037_27610 [Calditrichia bacterium]
MGIRFKLFLAVSVLVGAMLALQIYFNELARRELVEEMRQLSSTFNKATDAYFAHAWQEKIHPDSLSGFPEKVVKIEREVDEIKIPGPDSLLRLHSRIFTGKDTAGTVIQKILLGKTARVDTLFHRDSSLMRWRQQVAPFPSVDSIFGISRGKLSTFQITDEDVELVEIDLQLLRPDSVLPVIKKISAVHKPGEENVFFEIPDISRPSAPRIIRYRFGTGGIDEILTSVRNRGFFISGTIFLIFLVLLYLITRRFLNPVRQISHSFDRVVNGDLSLQLPESGGDEVGRLTRAFNQMVRELQKNREKEQLYRQQERLAALGQLAAGIAHEIKNPLNAIHLTIQHLSGKLSGPEGEKLQPYLKSVQSEIQRLDKLVNNFLSFARGEELQLAMADVTACVQEVLQLYEREFKTQNIQLDLRSSENFSAKLDVERFKTVLNNIILNAIQAMPDGGTLSIEADPKRRQIKIRDTGRGIKAEDLPHVFDLFYTTKSSGSGLGLPISYKIMQAHRGDIRIESEPGKGTEVTITLGENTEE